MIFAEAAPGTHPTIDLGCGTLCTFNYDSVISSLIAVVADRRDRVLGARRSSRRDEPGKVQAIFEWGYDQLRSLIKTNVSDDALFIIPLAMTLFLYILIANWIEIFPLAFFPVLHGANADLNQTLAMGLIVIFVVQWYSIRVLGLGGYLRRFTKPFELPLPARIVFIPLNILEEVVKPVTLALRLFGNIFAGAVMIGLIASFAQPSAAGCRHGRRNRARVNPAHHLEGVRRHLHRFHPGVHLHAADGHLFRRGPRGSRTRTSLGGTHDRPRN